MLIVLFDVIYCLIVTHKFSQTLPKNKRDNGIDIFVVSKTLEKKKWSPMPGANSCRKSETRRNNVMQKLFMYMYLPTTKLTVPLGAKVG